MILRFSHFQSMFSQFSPISCWLSYQATELLVDLAEDHWKSRKIWCPKSTNMFRPSRYIAGSWTQQKAMISTVKNPNHTGIQKLPMLKNVPAPGPTVPPVPAVSPPSWCPKSQIRREMRCDSLRKTWHSYPQRMEKSWNTSQNRIFWAVKHMAAPSFLGDKKNETGMMNEYILWSGSCAMPKSFFLSLGQFGCTLCVSNLVIISTKRHVQVYYIPHLFNNSKQMAYTKYHRACPSTIAMDQSQRAPASARSRRCSESHRLRPRPVEGVNLLISPKVDPYD